MQEYSHEIDRIWVEVRFQTQKKPPLSDLIFASYGAEGRTRTGTYFYG